MRLSDATRARLEQLGDIGEAWASTHPERIAALERRFGCAVGEPLDGGSAAFVATARCRDGQEAVLKVAVPEDGSRKDAFERELAVLSLASGRSHVEVLDHDREHRALLLERLGAPLERLGWPVERQLEVLGRTLSLGWAPAAGAPALPSLLDQADWLERLVASEASRSPGACRPETVALALASLERRRAAFDPADAVVIHADAHPGNVLATDGPDFKLIDPEGLLSTPEHDLAIPLRGWSEELLRASDPAGTLASWIERIARASGRDDVAAIGEWAFVERVSSGLYLLRLGLCDEGRAYLAVADRLH